MDQQTHNAAYKLFHYPFQVRVPQYMTYTEGEIETTGVAISGNREIDRECAQEMCSHTVTLAQIAKWHQAGSRIELVNIRDSVRMYDIIKEHLNDWLHKVETSHYEIEIPFEDLEVLDSLAEKLYLLARGIISQERASDTRSIFGLIRKSHFGKSTNPVVDAINASQHEPMTGLIQNINQRRRDWRS